MGLKVFRERFGQQLHDSVDGHWLKCRKSTGLTLIDDRCLRSRMLTTALYTNDLQSEMCRQITGRVDWLMDVTQLEQSYSFAAQQTRVVSAVRDGSQPVVMP